MCCAPLYRFFSFILNVFLQLPLPLSQLEIETEDDYNRRLYEYEKKKALNYRNQNNHQHAHIVNHIHNHHKSFKFTNSNLSIRSGDQYRSNTAIPNNLNGSNYGSESDNQSYQSDNDSYDFDARRGVSYRFDMEGPGSSRSVSYERSSPSQSQHNSPSRSDFNMDEWGVNSNQSNSQREDQENEKEHTSESRNVKHQPTKGGSSIDEGSTINIGDRIQALYVSENMWYPACVIDVNISDDGSIEFDIQYDGFEGDSAFEYNKPANQITPQQNEGDIDGLGAISEEDECD